MQWSSEYMCYNPCKDNMAQRQTDLTVGSRHCSEVDATLWRFVYLSERDILFA